MGQCKVPDCPGTTSYDDNAQGVLCTTCGTVATQDVLQHEWNGEPLSGSSFYFGPTTLKSLRRAGVGLAGQDSKEDKDRRNLTAIHQYILGTLTKLSYAGLVPRARNVFDQARALEKVRWGKKAALVAAAAILVAIRESKKGVMIVQLASLMDISPYALCRVFTHICTLLELHVPPFDSLSLLPHLQSHLKALTTTSNSPLPTPLIHILQPLSPVSVLHLASSLVALFNQHDEFSSTGPSACPSACALFILALEGQAVSSLPSYMILAKELGVKVGAKKDLVIERYRDISKIIEHWIADVPWLSDADHPDNKIGAKKRKISRRDVIAAGIRDVVQFRESIAKAQKSRENKTPVTVALEETADHDGGQKNSDSLMGVGRKRKCLGELDISESSRILRIPRPQPSKPSVSEVDLASLSLLSPLHPFAPDHPSSEHSKDSRRADSLQNQILTSSQFLTDVTLTRLQQLAVSRGGESEIRDDELFDQDELENFLRSKDEVTQLRELFGWDDEANPQVPGVGKPVTPISSQSRDWESADLEVWEDMGNDNGQAGEQILGEWQEASPLQDSVAEDDNFDVCDEW